MKFGADDLNIFLLLRIFSNMREQEEVLFFFRRTVASNSVLKYEKSWLSWLINLAVNMLEF